MRAELEAATARLREDLQGQLWNYYGALRDPASALKERVEQLEEKLEDFSQEAPAKVSPPPFDPQVNSKISMLTARLSALEQQTAAAAERQTRELEAMAKERAQHFALLKNRLDRVDATEVDLARQIQELQAVQAQSKEQLGIALHRQEVHFKEAQREQKEALQALQAACQHLQEELQAGARDRAGIKEQLSEKSSYLALQELDRRLQEQSASLHHKVAAVSSALGPLRDELQEKISRLEAQVKELDRELRRASEAAGREKATFEKSLDDVQRKLAQLGESQASEAANIGQKVSLLAKQTTDTFKTMKADLLQEISRQVAQCQQEQAAALHKLEKQNKEQTDEVKTRLQQQFNGQLQQMQHDLQAFLRKQDAALQDHVQQQLEAQEHSMQTQQVSICNRIDKSHADAVRKAEQRAEQLDADIQVCQELHASAQSVLDKKFIDLDKRIVQIVTELRLIKMDQEKVPSNEPDFGAKRSVEDKLISDLKAVKEGIDSIKQSVNGKGTQSPPPEVMTPPQPMVWSSVVSRPCSPPRSGPLLRPSACVRPVHVSPPKAWGPAMPPAPVRVGSVLQEPVAHPAAVPAGFLPPNPSPPSNPTTESSESTEHDGHEERPDTPLVVQVFCATIPGLPVISGEYHLVHGEHPNGRPLWKQRDGEHWLYCGTNNRWFVGGRDAKDWKFHCEAGFIYSEPVLDGRMPHQAAGSWARFQNGVFLADPSVTVTPLVPHSH